MNCCCSVTKLCPTLCDPMASLTFTVSQHLLKLRSIESVIPSIYLNLCCPLLLLPSVFPSIMDFPGSSDGKASAYNLEDPGSIPGLGRSSGEGNANPPQYSCLENPMDGGVWQATVHGVAKSWTRLRDVTLTFITFPASGSFSMSINLYQMAKVLELQLQHQSFQ